MKLFIKTILLTIIVFSYSCTGNDSYFEQITKVKTINERVLDLNKSLTEVRKSEKKSSLVKEDEDYLEYEYPIGDNDSYKTTYFFDAAGCYEVGLDTYFSLENDAVDVLNEIKAVFENHPDFGTPSNTNSLYEWNSKDGLVSVELDYVNQDRGMISLTIFANQ
ncbi:MAG: hypothetical protein HYU68_05020 [Bacteroidetes bacterium]|nr:hypothetical protein [Bacteroidota bacterium]